MGKNNKKIMGIARLYYVLIILMALGAIISAFYSFKLFLILLGICILAALLVIFKSIRIQRSIRRIIEDFNRNMITPESKMIARFRLPVLIASQDGKIVWYNDSFGRITKGQFKGLNLSDIIGESYDELLERNEAEINFFDRYFRAFLGRSEFDGEEFKVLFLADETRLKRIADEYYESRPAVALIAVDNFDEISKTAKDSEKALLRSTIQTEIESWVSFSSGINPKISGDRFMIVLEERHLKKIMEERFSILERIRKIKYANKTGLSLTIGVGHKGATLKDNEELARQALDMALGRGGDQAAVKTPDNQYRFFGGVTEVTGKRTRVRSRIVASALKELMEASDQVYIMGHSFSDFDALGAAYGLFCAARELKKPAKVVMDRLHTLAMPLYNALKQEDPEFLTAKGSEIIGTITKKTLLIVVDTHRRSFLDDPNVFDAAQTVVVIDHHRRAVDHIENAVLFYHETSSSSTCEMVSELLQYMCTGNISATAANALLSGIMLDTKNFVLHAGVRTFEALAFLSDCGADTVKVKKLFSDNLLTYRRRTEIVAGATMYGDCAIAVNNSNDENTRISSSEAADELLTLDNVNASFVICRTESGINISARSYGKINVQLIMEMLGGGGHQTMAACQLEETDFENAVKLLVGAIGEYKSNVTKERGEK